MTTEILCAECGLPGTRKVVGGIDFTGHAITRRNGDKHPFRTATPQSEADRTPSVRPPTRQPRSRLARRNPVGYSAAD